MKRGCIAVVNAAHARLFTYDERQEPALRDERDLVNAGRRGHDKFSTTKPGNRWQEGGRGSTDDHRTAQIAEHDQRFAELVIEQVLLHISQRGLPGVVLVASPRMIGALRPIVEPLRKRGLLLQEIEQDLAWMTPVQLHDHLAQLKVIEPRPRAPSSRGARFG